jgi:hypothetical protein
MLGSACVGEGSTVPPRVTLEVCATSVGHCMGRSLFLLDDASFTTAKERAVLQCSAGEAEHHLHIRMYIQSDYILLFSLPDNCHEKD